MLNLTTRVLPQNRLISIHQWNRSRCWYSIIFYIFVINGFLLYSVSLQTKNRQGFLFSFSNIMSQSTISRCMAWTLFNIYVQNLLLVQCGKAKEREPPFEYLGHQFLYFTPEHVYGIGRCITWCDKSHWIFLCGLVQRSATSMIQDISQNRSLEGQLSNRNRILFPVTLPIDEWLYLPYHHNSDLIIVT